MVGKPYADSLHSADRAHGSRDLSAHSMLPPHAVIHLCCPRVVPKRPSRRKRRIRRERRIRKCKVLLIPRSVDRLSSNCAGSCCRVRRNQWYRHSIPQRPTQKIFVVDHLRPQQVLPPLFQMSVYPVRVAKVSVCLQLHFPLPITVRWAPVVLIHRFIPLSLRTV